jgi:hypothetical protein
MTDDAYLALLTGPGATLGVPPYRIAELTGEDLAAVEAVAG